MDPPRLIVFSTPLISTFVLDETHHILFDAGDGATALLEGKIDKARVVAPRMLTATTSPACLSCSTSAEALPPQMESRSGSYIQKRAAR